MIKSIKIKGYKKFDDYTVIFKEGINIVVGDNESGKSTIIEAIDIVLNGRLPFKELSALKYYMKNNNIKFLEENRNIENLPKIEIEVEFFEPELEENIIFERYYGSRYLENIKNNSYKHEKYGILFECIPDDNYQEEIREFVNDGIVPFEYYICKWSTFKDEIYKTRDRNRVKTFILDNTKKLDSYNINKYSFEIFNKKFDDAIQRKVKSEFYLIGEKIFNDEEHSIGEGQSVNFLLENTPFSKYISILDEEVLLELKGTGKERKIITEFALANNSYVNIFIIEEPEMNLSHVNVNSLINKLEEKYINSREDKKQIIVTTHSNLIARKLELNNIIFISEGTKSKQLINIDTKTVKYFKKADNNNVIDILLSKKNIIVEGAAEYILLPELFEKYINSLEEPNRILGNKLTDYGITITSGQGVTHEHYKNLLENQDNKSIFITDNDEKQAHIYSIDSSKNFNKISGESIADWTFEVAMYNSNSEVLKEIFNVENNARVSSKYKDKEMGSKTLAYMLKNKTKVALELVDHVENLVIPPYILEAFEWIKN